MIKKNGFTLIEMLVVVIIIGVVLGIAIPSVVNLIEKKGKDEYNVQIKLIESATELYVLKHRGIFNNNLDATCFKLSYDSLKQSENIKEGEITCDGDIIIKRDDNDYKYEYNLTCQDKNGTKFNEKQNISDTCIILN